MRIPVTVLLLAIAACGGGGGGDDDTGGPDAPPPDADIPDPPQCLDSRDALYAYNFLDGNATLRFNDMTIVAGAQTFGPPAPRQYQLGSDPANGTLPDRTTIELQWFVDAVQMRLYIYFASDGVDWWAYELRTYDGDPNPDWIYYVRELFRCPVGKHYSGDLTLTGDPTNELAGTITFQDIWIRAFVDDEPPGVQMPIAEQLVRPFCAYYKACGSYSAPLNSCINELGRPATAFRPEAFMAASQCEIAQNCEDSDARMACWRTNEPAPLAYHDTFFAQCEAHSTTCDGAPDPACGATAVNWYLADLPYWNEEFVAGLTTCVAPGTPCASFPTEACLNGAAAWYGLDLGL